MKERAKSQPTGKVPISLHHRGGDQTSSSSFPGSRLKTLYFEVMYLFILR